MIGSKMEHRGIEPGIPIAPMEHLIGELIDIYNLGTIYHDYSNQCCVF